MCLALPGRLESIHEAAPGEEKTREGAVEWRMGTVRFGQTTQEVCLVYVPDAAVGDWLIVHVGFAIQRMSEEQAMRTLQIAEGQA